jgi:dTDP-4-dehydrorhamnose 3,5-epimerase-like enzyme
VAEEPKLLQGRLAVDDRGSVSFVNEFNFAGVKRFYTVANHASNFVRAWHGHRHEAKYCTVVAGSALVCCIAIDNWDNPSADPKIHRFVLSELSPAILCVPAGYINGFMTLAADTKVMFFSSSTLEESVNDDVRFPARKWDPWSVVER